jgi:hypothetical protein
MDVRLEAVNRPAFATVGCSLTISVKDAAPAPRSEGFRLGELGELIFKFAIEGRRVAETADCAREFSELSVPRESCLSGFESWEPEFETTAGIAESEAPP